MNNYSDFSRIAITGINVAEYFLSYKRNRISMVLVLTFFNTTIMCISFFYPSDQLFNHILSMIIWLSSLGILIGTTHQ